MALYAGITTNADQKRKQHAATRRNLRKWVIANGGKPFPSRELALAWLKTQPGEHDPMAAPSPGQWVGYTFEFDAGGN